jgi:RNA polymerase sigma-70 factor (ECF subfamily)
VPPPFRAVFDQEFGYVWNTLRRLGVRNADLEDVTHEVFLVFHRRMADYDPARPLRPKLARHRHEVPSAEEHVARTTSGRRSSSDDRAASSSCARSRSSIPIAARCS